VSVIETQPSIFGAIEIADQLEQAVVDTLSLWFRTYLTEYELQAGLITNKYEDLKHPLPRAYLKANQVDASSAEAMPSIVVVSPGLSPRNAPKAEGDGTFRVFWNIGVGAFASANTRKDTLKLIRVYAAIIRTIMLQKQGLGGYADGTTWLDESYDNDFGFADDQTISACQVAFDIEVAGVVSRYGGPAAVMPDPDMPGSHWPQVLTHEEIVEIEEEQ
jgi:hypothetical protein